MSKDVNFIGQPIFSQLLKPVSKRRIDKIAKQHRSDRYTKKFDTYNHFISMLYCIFHGCTSIREVVTGMQACSKKLNHLGLNYCVRGTTLSDANKRRCAEVFESIYYDLLTKLRRVLSDSRKFKGKLYIVDSTTISLFKEILKNAGRTPANGKRKGGMKVHTMIRADQDVPCLVKMTAAASHDVTFIKNLKLVQGSIIVFDKGYVNYEQYDLWGEEGITWVTRLRKGASYIIDDDLPITKEQQVEGILSDQLITLGHRTHENIVRTKARLILYHDTEKNIILEFITNNILFEAKVICQIYKYRWQIEMLYKRLKQNYPLQYFLGDNENAIKVQVWCALIADLLIKNIQKKIKRKWSYSNLKSMVRLHLMNYIHLIKFLNDPDKALINLRPKKRPPPNLFSM